MTPARLDDVRAAAHRRPQPLGRPLGDVPGVGDGFDGEVDAEERPDADAVPAPGA
ncbi:hypothetical protein [Streptomyces antnestii]|uniref:hypothetical protein n=1 Tax=Streptomyces antnestii TaxID=2494256 RepID=UPI00167211AA|nr:hypothetical protein [Streptomyces sp. San01]